MHRNNQGQERSITIGRSWSGSGHAGPGSCGGALITASTKLQNNIIGIHVAAGAGVMVSAMVTYEDLTVIDSSNLRSERLSCVTLARKPSHINCRTKLKLSPIGEWVDSNKVPSAMPFIDNRPNEDPLAISLLKHSGPLVDEPLGYENAVDLVQFKIDASICHGGQRYLTTDEAIQGIDGLDGIDMNTSAGLPYTVHGKRKRDMIQNGQLVDPYCKLMLESCENCIDNGLDPGVVYTSCCKDELRPIEKVESGKTRMIECAPLHYVIAVRKRLGYVASLLHNNVGFGTGIAVGIDPEAMWHPLMRAAIEFGDRCMCLDFSNFDGRVSPFMIERAIRMLCELSGLDVNTTNSLVMSYTRTRRQLGNLVLHIVGGLPSGCPLTSIIGSIINLCNLYYALTYALRTNVQQVNNLVRVLVYGDDVLMILSRKVVSVDISRFVAVLNDLGMVVTGATKNEDVSIKPLCDAEFLKRKWRLDGHGLFHPTATSS
nr:MAG: RNA-dependent RNA polymerase [Riboviria sp.]